MGYGPWKNPPRDPGRRVGRRTPSSVDIVDLEAGDASTASRPALQVRIIHLEIFVILLETPDGQLLDRQLPDRVALRHAIWRSNDLDDKLRLEMSDFQEDDGEVVDEEQSVDERDTERDSSRIVWIAHFEDAEAVEEPVGDGEDEDEQYDDRTEDEDSRSSRAQPPKEQSPASERQDDQLERETDELAFTVRQARLCFPVKRTNLWKHDHDDRGDVRHDAERA